MDAQAVEVDGQVMARFEISHHGRDLDGSTDVVRVGIWDIVLALAHHPHRFQQLKMYKHYRVKEISLRSKSRVFKIV